MTAALSDGWGGDNSGDCGLQSECKGLTFQRAGLGSLLGSVGRERVLQWAPGFGGGLG